MNMYEEFPWLLPTGGCFTNGHSYTVAWVPSTIAFYLFIKWYLTEHNRIVRIKSWYWLNGSCSDHLSVDACHKLREMCFFVGHKLQPWQFRALQQADGTGLDVDFVDSNLRSRKDGTN